MQDEVFQKNCFQQCYVSHDILRGCLNGDWYIGQVGYLG